jgi:hypothetical protein
VTTAEPKPSPFAVSIRLTEPGGELMAKADVIGPKMTLRSLSVVKGANGDGPRVEMPYHLVGSVRHDLVIVHDLDLRKAIDVAIIDAFVKATIDRHARKGDPGELTP